ncbi:class I SAM-dependent DNA methyltransferase [Chryseobacterium paridis]|uniref:Class I SAM-dependent methyltransferase n=1 Tax=Chryseobacterium paridis TaxID=2800328 RepID=A0ABS1FUU6_9FLAO|nr:class I SAM-dependent methyltransferase [Chryseobacterium paridis]MBK1896198.1 class I SAM-dependent methyltransferase [Chryseobacterium paridis]
MKILKPVEAFDKAAKIYQDKFMDVSSFGNTFDLFCNNIKSNDADILDIACGPGNITKYLLDRKPDYDILGIDLSSKMLELAKINNPTARFELMNCNDISKIEQKFDGIICGFCLPYLAKEEAIQLIADSSGLLKPGGMFYLSTMEDDYSKSGLITSSLGDQVYLYYHQEDYLTKAFQDNNFEVIKLKRFDSIDKDGAPIIDLVLIGKLI